MLRPALLVVLLLLAVGIVASQFAGSTAPLDGSTPPLNGSTTPVAEPTTPVAETTTPVAETTPLLATPSAPALEQSFFDQANRLFFEQSKSRACKAFEDFLRKHPSSVLTREAQVKGARVCLPQGLYSPLSHEQLRSLADGGGPVDLPLAIAHLTLHERGNEYLPEGGHRINLALEQLETLARRSEGRWAREARALYMGTALPRMERFVDYPQIVEKLCEGVLGLEPSPDERARALYLRARSWLKANAEEQGARAEQELIELGRGKSEFADDALFLLGQRREAKGQYVEAIEIYGQIRSRFSGTTSNVHAQAGSRIEDLQRSELSVSVQYIELPGVQPTLRLSHRNVKEVTFTLRRADPMRESPESLLGAAPMGRPGEVVKTWTRKISAPSTHVSALQEEPIEAPGPGAWIVEASAGKERASDWLLISPLAMALKVAHDEVAVFVADAVTGEAARNAEVVVFASSSDSETRYARLQGRTDDTGLVRLPLKLPGTLQDITAWASAGGHLTFSKGRASGFSPDDGRDLLAAVLTDRPLYKPGETAGAKLFLRSRASGPSTPVANRAVRVRVFDAQSREVHAKELTTSAFGTAAFGFPIGKDATLGQWHIRVETQPYQSIEHLDKGFRVEEFKAPEFLVSVAAGEAPTRGRPVKVRITASRFSGGPVANATGRAIVTAQDFGHQWGPWEDDVPSSSPSSFVTFWRRKHGQTTHTFKTGEDGSAELELPSPEETGERTYQLQVFVTDASRREVEGGGTLHVSLRPYFIDIRSDRYLYKPGEPIKIKLRAEDASGVAQSPVVELQLVRLGENWSKTVLLKRSARLTNGRAEVVLDEDLVGPVRIEVRDPDWPENRMPHASTDVWLTSDVKPFTPSDEGLQLITARAPLAVGGMVRALLVTPTEGGHALFTIEGERLHAAKAVKLNGRARFVELPVTAAMAPNAWLHLGRFEQGAFLEHQEEVKIVGSGKALQVDVSHSAEVVEPGAAQKARVQVKGARGPVELMVSSVDEAIFAIQPDQGDLLSFFSGRPQEQWVRTAHTLSEREFRPVPRKEEKQQAAPAPQSEDDRASATAVVPTPPSNAPTAPTPAADEEGAKASQEKKAETASKAGSAPAAVAAPAPAPRGKVFDMGAETPVKVRTHFSSSAGWFPQVSQGQAAALSLQVPDSLTRFRTLAVAVTQGEFMGVGKARFRTEKPLMVRLQAPRFFTERDVVTLSAIVSNRLARRASVQVAFTAPGLEPIDPTQRTVQVPAGGDTRVDVRYRVVKPGEAKIQVVARGGGAQDAMALTLPVVVHGSAQRATFAGRLSDGVELRMKLPGQRNASATRFELTFSPTLASVMMDALPYLAQYPYGCVEQTLSRFVPASIAAKTARDLGLPKSRVPAELDAMVDAGLKRLYGFQHGDGGWGWWQADATNRWMTAYVVYGLSLGRAAGLTVDQAVLERGRSYLTSQLGAALDSPEEHTWMLFALASTGSAPKEGLDKAFERRGELSKRGRALLALALLSVKDPRARVAVENLDDIVRVAQERQGASVGDANDTWQTSEAIEATAYTLMAIHRHDPDSPLVQPLTDFLVTRREGGRWRTTRDTAFALYALSEIAAREKAGAAAGTFIIHVNGREATRLRFSAGGMDLSGPVVLTDAAFRPGENTVFVLRDGAAVTGYYAATFDVYNRDENVKGVGGDVKVDRTYTLLGRPSAAAERVSASTEYGMPVESGVRVRVDLEVKADKAAEFLLIEDLKPAGFETVALQSGPELCEHRCAHVELRSDRVAIFLSQLPVGVTKFSYELRAEVPGRFHALPARVEAMYAPELRATSDEMRLEVRDAPDPARQGVAKDGR